LNHPAHPLIGKLLWLGDDDPQLYTVSRFEADLGHGLLLCSRVDPVTGQPLDSSHVVDLQHPAAADEAEIFDSWERLRCAIEGPIDGNRVVQIGPELVRGGRSDHGNGAA
jgi:hypothetical protein